MCQWTIDSKRLILEYFDLIYDSPSHIYRCALPFSPPSSWLHQHYHAEFSQRIKLVKGCSAGWGTCFRTVSLGYYVEAIACWRNTVAISLLFHPIIILNAITGSQIAALPVHDHSAESLAFSTNGVLLASGGTNGIVELWDMQTGGVVKTFNGHTKKVNSIAISADCTVVASGSYDETICLWDIQTGECNHVIEQQGQAVSVCFSPLVPQYLIFASGGKIQQWGIDGHQVAPTLDGNYAAFSSDGTQFFVCKKNVVEVRDSYSGEIVAQFHMAGISCWCCCFSPDGKLIAVAGDHTAYIWDITGSYPQLVETFVGHVSPILFLAFSSTSLISVSNYKVVKFWENGTSSMAPAVTNPEPTPLNSAPIKTITLQAKDGITISSDLDGVVRIWDITTGICRASFQTPSKGFHCLDTQLIGGRLISVWCTDENLTIWDTEKGELLRTVNAPKHEVKDLRISGDGSMVFCLDAESIQAWSVWTGEVMGKKNHHLLLLGDHFLVVDGLRVWVPFKFGHTKAQGWDFGGPDLSTMELSNAPPNWPHLNFVGIVREQRLSMPGIEDTATGKVVFRLPGRLARPSDVQWDGQHLVAGYDSGEVLILEYTHVLE